MEIECKVAPQEEEGGRKERTEHRSEPRYLTGSLCCDPKIRVLPPFTDERMDAPDAYAVSSDMEVDRVGIRILVWSIPKCMLFLAQGFSGVCHGRPALECLLCSVRSVKQIGATQAPIQAREIQQ